jgi:hypothetical protein
MARHTPKTISLCTLNSWSSAHSCRVDSQGSPTRLRCAAVLEENGLGYGSYGFMITILPRACGWRKPCATGNICFLVHNEIRLGPFC